MNNRLSEGDWKIPHRGNTGERYRFVELNLKVWATAVNSAGRQMQEGKWNSDAGNSPASHIRREKVMQELKEENNYSGNNEEGREKSAR